MDRLSHLMSVIVNKRLLPSSRSNAEAGEDTLPKKASPRAAKDNKESGQPLVRLLDPSSRPPVTPIERLTVTALKHQGPTLFSELVRRVVREVYFDEIRKGASVVDIGLFGSTLYTRDVTRELKAGDGVLWEINQEWEIV